MADQQENLEYTDGNELFQAALGYDVQPEPDVEAEQQVETTGERPRDESGKFIAKPKADEKTETEQKSAPAPAPEKTDAMVPSFRLREQREEYEARIAALQRQLSQPQQQPAQQQQPVDFFADPDAAIDQRLSPFKNDLKNLQTTMLTQSSEALNIARHGIEIVDAAKAAAQEALNNRDPEIRLVEQKMSESRDPVGVLIAWHKDRQFKIETGGDLDAYNEKIKEKLLADPDFLAKAVASFKAQATGRPQPQSQVQIPKSLSSAAAAAPANVRGGDGDDSPEAIWAHATH